MNIDSNPDKLEDKNKQLKRRCAALGAMATVAAVAVFSGPIMDHAFPYRSLESDLEQRGPEDYDEFSKSNNCEVETETATGSYGHASKITGANTFITEKDVRRASGQEDVSGATIAANELNLGAEGTFTLCVGKGDNTMYFMSGVDGNIVQVDEDRAKALPGKPNHGQQEDG